MSTLAPDVTRELEQHRRALTGYCYRMLGSGSEAEDAVQETFVKAWRGAGTLQDRGALKGWLYRIAHNVCLDMLATTQRRATPMDLGPASRADAPLGDPSHAWITPIADAKVLDTEVDPAAAAEARESLRLAFVAALQHLPPRQRAVLVLREVLRWPAADVAELLETSVASVNSALQRARATLAELDLDRDSGPSRPADAGDAELLARYCAAFEAYDMDALTALLREDAAFSMPPFGLWVRGPQDIRAFMLGPGAKCQGSRTVPVRANGGPAFALYNPVEGGGFEGWAVVVVEPDGAGRVAGLHHFIGAEHFEAFELPVRLEA